MPNSFDARVRRYLEQLGDRYSLNESSGLYQPDRKPSSEPPTPNQTSETPPQQLGKEPHTPIYVNVRRDRVAIWLPAILSALTLVLLFFTVKYTRRQWLEANRSANASEIAANAARDAAVIANSTLTEMRDDAQRTLNASREATHLDQRAWVGLSQLEAVPTSGGFEVKGSAINSGKTPADDVRAAVGVYGRFVAGPTYTPTEGDYDWIRYIIKKTWNAEVKQYTLLYPSGLDPQSPYRGPLPPKLTARDWVGAPRIDPMGVLPPGNNPYAIPFTNLLQNAGGSYFTLIFYGEIRYKDFIGKEWTTQFCYLVRREAAPLVPCEKFNSMK